MNTTLEITHHQDPDGRTVVVARGEVDIATATRLRSALTEHSARGKALVLDVTSAELIDAAGLRAFTAAQRHTAEIGKPAITLRGVSPVLAKTLQITGLDHLFPREPAPLLEQRIPDAPRSSRRAQLVEPGHVEPAHEHLRRSGEPAAIPALAAA